MFLTSSSVKKFESFKAANSEEAALLEKLDPHRLPQHVAAIMDGNGRWAQRRHLPRLAGHRAGVKASRVVIETCAQLHIPCLTLYAFLARELAAAAARSGIFLMRLLREYLKRELPLIQDNNIRLLAIGRLQSASGNGPQGSRRRHASNGRATQE